MIGGGIRGPPPPNAHPATHRSARALSQRDFAHALSSLGSDRGARFAAAGVQCAAPNPRSSGGRRARRGALEGQWDGSYSSAATGRSGSISFTLTATGDSAFGDVVMIPRGLGRPLQAWNNAAAPADAAPPRPAVLTINFVRVAAGRVTGTLAPYADPETGVQLFPSRATVGVANSGAGEAGSPRCSRARFNASSMFP